MDGSVFHGVSVGQFCCKHGAETEMGQAQLNVCVYGSLHVNERRAIATDLTEIQKSVRGACDAQEAKSR